MTYTFTVGKFYNRNFLNVADRKLDSFLCVERYKNQIKTIIKKPYSQKKKCFTTNKYNVKTFAL